MLRTVLVLVDVSPVITILGIAMSGFTINPIFYGLVADMAKGSEHGMRRI